MRLPEERSSSARPMSVEAAPAVVCTVRRDVVGSPGVVGGEVAHDPGRYALHLARV